VILFGCSNPKPVSKISNPAAEHCTKQGYEYEIRTDSDGSQSGYCIFSDTECEEWAFYRGECT